MTDEKAYPHHFYDELDYATLVNPENIELFPHQIEAMKAITAGKNSHIIIPHTPRDFHGGKLGFTATMRSRELIDDMFIIQHSKPAMSDMMIVKPRNENALNNLFVSLEYDYAETETRIMELLSHNLGAWKHPTHIRVCNGKAIHFYMLEPTMLSVQIALLCGFELKQRIERIVESEVPEPIKQELKFSNTSLLAAFPDGIKIDDFTKFSGRIGPELEPAIGRIENAKHNKKKRKTKIK